MPVEATTEEEQGDGGDIDANGAHADLLDFVKEGQQLLEKELDSLPDSADEGCIDEEATEQEWATIEELLIEHERLLLDDKPLLTKLFRKKPPEKIVLALLSNVQSSAASSGTPRISELKDENTKTILFYALESGMSLHVIEEIVEKDEDIICVTDNTGKYPLAAACIFASKHGLDDHAKGIIRYLVNKGGNSKYMICPLLATVAIDEVSDSVIEYLLVVGDHKMMGTMASPTTGLLPLHTAIIRDTRSNELVARLLEGDEIRWELFSSFMIDQLAKRTYGSEELRVLMNKKLVERWPVAVLLFEFYLRTAQVGVFVEAVQSFLSGSSNRSANLCLFAFTAYFVLKESSEVNFQRWAYLFDFWNYVDVSSILVVLASAIRMEKDNNLDPEDVTPLLLAGAGFVVAGLILFLRATFLPFAVFVGGLILILKTLGPFLVVSGLMVFGYSVMYHIYFFDEGMCKLPPEERGDDPDFCTLSTSLLQTLNFFYAGPEKTSAWWLDQLFGLAVVIILLNVVIAIVSDAWEDGKKEAGVAFWSYRLSFLAEVESIGSIRDFFAPLLGLNTNNGDEARTASTATRINRDYFGEDRNSLVVSLFGRIRSGSFNLFRSVDNLGRWSVRDKTLWGDTPYEGNIHCADDYYRYNLGLNRYSSKMSKDDFRKLISSGSFERNWYWASRVSEEDFVKYPYIKGRVQVAFEFVMYILLYPLGLVTMGLFWPQQVRENIFTVTNVGSYEQLSDEINKSIETTEAERAKKTRATRRTVPESAKPSIDERVDALESKIGALETKLETKLDALLKLVADA